MANQVIKGNNAVTVGDDEMQIGQHRSMALLFEQIYTLCKKCGEIAKIEIKKK